ncbi:MAG: hypothetical protein OES79_12640, partial [Planctomycetota bacterium]|nr:hypothetical protein [Planctomycetota bacterium]
GLRVSAQRSGTLTDLVFQFHHSSCDAVGALRFIEDLLVIYAALVDTDAQPAGVRSIDERRLPERGQFGLTRRKLLGMLHKQSVGLLGARQFLMRTPVPVQPIAIESAGAALPSDFPAAQAHIFSEMETAALLAAARDAGTTVNNLLVRDLFLALGDFRLRRQLSDDHQWLRLSIPVNLRSQDDERLSAANVVSMIFLDRRPFEFGNELALLKGIDHEMRRIKKNQLGLTFPLSLRFTRSLPGSISRMRRMSKKEICRGTAVLSNLVRPFIDAPLHRCDGKINAGGMILERIEFLPPVRPYTLAAFGALTYADRLHLALHFDQRGLATTEATELLKDFIGHISATARRDH